MRHSIRLRQPSCLLTELLDSVYEPVQIRRNEQIVINRRLPWAVKHAPKKGLRSSSSLLLRIVHALHFSP
jgi:hypothetical protein